MPKQKALYKIRLRNRGDVFLMVGYELNSELDVKIINLEHQEVYVGQSNDIELRSQAARIRLTFDEFFQKAINALIKTESDKSNLIFYLDEQNDMYKFQWKSIDEEQTIISLGSVDVRKESFAATLTDMFEIISMEMYWMRKEIKDLNAEVKKSQKQASNAMKQLCLATELKEKLEKEMYSKFVLVLNEKKRKIRELQQKNKHNSHSNNADFQKKSKKFSKPLVSDSSDDTNIDEPVPSTSKSVKSLLFLEDTKSILPTNQNRIRNRKAIVSKKENAKKLTAFINSDQTHKNITVDDDESDELLFDDL